MSHEKLRNGFDAARFKIAPILPEPLSTWANLKFHSPNQSRFHYFTSLPVAELIAVITKAEIHGTLPKEGEAIVAANHKKKINAFTMHWFPVHTVGRTIRTFARRTLQDPTADEGEEFNGLKQESQQDKSLLKSLGEAVEPWYTQGFAPYQVDRGLATSATLKAFRDSLRDLRAGHMVGIFPQGTRKTKFDLLEMQDGVVDLARISGAPIYPVGLDEPRINIGKPYYYKDIPQKPGASKEEQKQTAKEFIAGTIAEQITNTGLKAAWLLKNEFGLTMEQIREIHGRNPDLGAAVDILRMSRPSSAEDAWENIEEVDTHARFG